MDFKQKKQERKFSFFARRALLSCKVSPLNRVTSLALFGGSIRLVSSFRYFSPQEGLLPSSSEKCPREGTNVEGGCEYSYAVTKQRSC